jgi:hypothetical protein
MRTNISWRLLQRFAIEKKLFVYDAGIRDGNMDYNSPQLHSGIRATIFGGSGKHNVTQVPSADPLQPNSDSPTLLS